MDSDIHASPPPTLDVIELLKRYAKLGLSANITSVWRALAKLVEACGFPLPLPIPSPFPVPHSHEHCFPFLVHLLSTTAHLYSPATLSLAICVVSNSLGHPDPYPS